MPEDTKRKTELDQMNIIAKMQPTNEGNELTLIARENTPSDPKALTDTDAKEEGDISITITKEKAQRLHEEGITDKETSNIIVEMFENHERTVNLSKQRASKEIIEEAIQRDTKQLPKQIAAMRHLLSIKDLIEENNEADKMSPLFKENVDPENGLGITKAVMDRLQYLPDLLDRAVMEEPVDNSNMYTIKSTLPGRSKGGIGLIGLEYTYIAPDKNTACKIAKQYNNDMCSGAMKALLAYWAYANEKGAFFFSANLSTIISMISGHARKSYIESGEKEKFWHLSKLLENTKLTITINNNGEEISVKHRLLDIKATTHGRGENRTGDYPLKIQVRVLDPDDFRQKANLATEISKGTLKLRSEDIMLALTLQTRASQRRSIGTSEYDEDHLIKRSNLIKTHQASPRMGRKRLEEKLDRMKEAEVVDDWKTKNGRYAIKHRKRKAKN